MERYFQAFQGARVEVPLELARELVHGAVDYARRLGLEPYRGFAAAATQLGEFTAPARIGFGDHGRPRCCQDEDPPAPRLPTRGSVRP